MGAPPNGPRTRPPAPGASGKQLCRRPRDLSPHSLGYACLRALSPTSRSPTPPPPPHLFPHTPSLLERLLERHPPVRLVGVGGTPEPGEAGEGGGSRGSCVWQLGGAAACGTCSGPRLLASTRIPPCYCTPHVPLADAVKVLGTKAEMRRTRRSSRRAVVGQGARGRRAGPTWR